MVNTFAAQDIITVLHLDNDWILNLPYLRELPPRMCVCELDGKTNIFDAREIPKNHSASREMYQPPYSVKEHLLK